MGAAFSLIAMIACGLGFSELQMRLGADIIDVLRGGYDADMVQERFLIYGEAGRALYARAALTLDAVYPVAYSTFFACLIVMGGSARAPDIWSLCRLSLRCLIWARISASTCC